MTIATHMFPLAVVATINRRLASSADFVAAVMMNGLLDSIARGDFLLRDRREIMYACKGQHF